MSVFHQGENDCLFTGRLPEPNNIGEALGQSVP